MSSLSEPEELRFGDWHARRDSGELCGSSGVEHLEPKVMELLLLLGNEANRVFSRDELMQRLWPRQVVGDDTLARVVSKLRKALGDDPKTPRYIETIPKRGYRFIGPPAPIAQAFLQADIAPAPVSLATLHTPKPRSPHGYRYTALVCTLILAVLVGWVTTRPQPDIPASTVSSEAGTLTERANDFYFQYSRLDNEAAIELFERVVALHPEHAPAYAGLANALAQRVIRWPGQGAEFTRLGDALKHGHTRTAKARAQLQRALQFAERAVQLAPRDASALKALGFVRSVLEDFAGAQLAYQQSVALDPDAWGPMINIGDLLEISGKAEQAVPHFEAAFAAMTRVYPQQTARIRPWYAETALLIGDRHRALKDLEKSERWYRQVLEIAPFHAAATSRLARLLHNSGRAEEATKLCAHLRLRVGATTACERS